MQTNTKTFNFDPGTFEWYYNDIKAPKFRQLKIKFTDIGSFKIKNNQADLPSRVVDNQTLEISSRPMIISYNNLEYKEIPNLNIEQPKPTNPIRVFRQFIDHENSNFQNRESDLSSFLFFSLYLFRF